MQRLTDLKAKTTLKSVIANEEILTPQEKVKAIRTETYTLTPDMPEKLI
jgi:hypothetical protein